MHGIIIVGLLLSSNGIGTIIAKDNSIISNALPLSVPLINENNCKCTIDIITDSIVAVIC